MGSTFNNYSQNLFSKSFSNNINFTADHYSGPFILHQVTCPHKICFYKTVNFDNSKLTSVLPSMLSTIQLLPPGGLYQPVESIGSLHLQTRDAFIPEFTNSIFAQLWFTKIRINTTNNVFRKHPYRNGPLISQVEIESHFKQISFYYFQ